MAPEPNVVKNPQEARQGQHAGVRYVLIFGTILVVIALGAVAIFTK